MRWGHRRTTRRRTVLVCPHCGSADLVFEAGLVTGQKYRCTRCGYVGALVLETDLPAESAEATDARDASSPR
jgi:transposase-like protein